MGCLQINPAYSCNCPIPWADLESFPNIERMEDMRCYKCAVLDIQQCYLESLQRAEKDYQSKKRSLERKLEGLTSNLCTTLRYHRDVNTSRRELEDLQADFKNTTNALVDKREGDLESLRRKYSDWQRLHGCSC